MLPVATCDMTEHQRRLSDSINVLPNATRVIDVSGTVITRNKAAGELTGVKSEKMLSGKLQRIKPCQFVV